MPERVDCDRVRGRFWSKLKDEGISMTDGVLTKSIQKGPVVVPTAARVVLTGVPTADGVREGRPTQSSNDKSET